MLHKKQIMNVSVKEHSATSPHDIEQTEVRQTERKREKSGVQL